MQEAVLSAEEVAPLSVDGDRPSPVIGEVEELRARLATAEAKIANLQCALESSRIIGAAIGVLMTQHHVTYEGGFELLRAASQSLHRKLRDVAADVVYTGALELPTRPPRLPS
jgi:AmiR/NasT family two-component response regulator